MATAGAADAGAWTVEGAIGRPYKLEGHPELGSNPTACLTARRLEGARDFLRPDTLVSLSHFLLAKIEEGMLGETSTTSPIRPIVAAG